MKLSLHRNSKDMKKHLLYIIALFLAVGVSAQEKRSFRRVEFHFQAGGGLFLESGAGAKGENPGLVTRQSLGVDIRLNEKWSVMPGFGYRDEMGDYAHFSDSGNSPDYLEVYDFPLVGRYHLGTNANRLVLGLGPAFSYVSSSNTYYNDGDPDFPINGKKKFKKFDVGLQPSVYFLFWKHFQIGLEGNIGLLNMRRQYPKYNITSSTHLHYLALMCGVHF